MLLHITLKLFKYLTLTFNKPIRISIHIFKVIRKQNGAIIVLKPRENALYIYILNDILFCLAANGFLGDGILKGVLN